MNLASNCIGGVKCDVEPRHFDYILSMLDKVEPAVDEIRDIYDNDPMLLGRTRGLGLLPQADAVRLGVVGPVARGSGITHDVRKDSPYAAYPELEFEVIHRDGCCVNSRTLVRLDEIFQSFRIIRQCCEKCPDGPVTAPMNQIHRPRPAPAAKRRAARSSTISVPTTRYAGPGVKWRVPSLHELGSLGVMMRDCTVADVALITNSIDPCVSCTER